MGKIFKNFIKRKDEQAAEKQRTFLFGAKKKEDTVGFNSIIDVSDYHTEEGLEDSPIADSVIKRAKKEPRHKEKHDSIIGPESSALGQTLAKRRYTGKRKGAFGALKNKVQPLFAAQKTKKTSNSAALEFAESRRRLGKKGRRNRRIALYASTGLVVVVALLVVFLAPRGEAAPAETGQAMAAASQENEALPTASLDATSLSTAPSDTAAPDAAALVQGQRVFGADSIIKATQTAIPTTSPDNSLDSVPVKTTTPEEEPTPTEKSTPIATTKPDPTPIPVTVQELIEDFVVEADLYYNDVHYSSNHYEYTNDELYILAQLIDGEAGGESMEGKIAVGNVVMNRLFYGYWGHTIKSVVTAGGQFSGYSSSIRPSSSCKAAARAVLDYEVWVVTQNTYFFRSGAPAGRDWGSHDFYKKIGGHCFYTESFHGRSRVGSVPPRLFERTFKYPQYGCKPEKRVKRVQLMLNKLGYEFHADGYFGKDTEEALIEFQKDKGLEADGVAGPSTLKALIKAYGIKDYYSEFC